MLDVLGFADSLNLNGNNKETIIQNTAAIIAEAKTVGLVMNEKKNKVMELLGNGQEVFVVEGLVFEKVDQFEYLTTIIKSDNDWSAEIVNRIHKAEKAYLRAVKIF